MSVLGKREKAFIYACFLALNVQLGQDQKMGFSEKTAIDTVCQAYFSMPKEKILLMDQAAQAAVRIFLRAEPWLQCEGGGSLTVSVQIKDDDVRNIVCSKKRADWEFGFLCGGSHTKRRFNFCEDTDFGDQLFGVSCSNEYKLETEPVFKELEKLEKRGMDWKNIVDKEERFYWPLQSAVIKELQRMNLDGNIPEKLMQNLLGKRDFYRVIMEEKEKVTRVEACNLYGSLNKRTKECTAGVLVGRIKKPKNILSMDCKPMAKCLSIITCDEGWAFSVKVVQGQMRRVSRKLYLELGLVGVPQVTHLQIEPW